MSESVNLCGFVPMIGQDGERAAAIDPASTVFLHWDEDQAIDPAALSGVLEQARIAAWTDVTIVSGESVDGIWLRLTAVESGTCRIEAKPDTVASGLCKPAVPARSPAIAEGDSLAYLVVRVQADAPQRRWELGAVGHGPAGQQLADRLCGQIRAWGTARNEEPQVTAYRNDIPADDLVGLVVITKRDCSLTVAYPAA